MGLVATVGKGVKDTCVADRIERGRCKILLKGAPKPYLIIDFDKPDSPLGADQKRCDYLFVEEDPADSGWVVPLELKSGRVDVSHAVEQLQAGARAAEENISQRLSIIFRPVLVCSGRIHKAERRAMRKKVHFHGHREPLRQIRCGTRLATRLT